MTSVLRIISVGGLLATALRITAAPEDPPPGLAAGHPADRGIAGHPKVLFADDFEPGSLEDLAGRWSSIKSIERSIVTLDEGSPIAAGRRCVRVIATAGVNEGGHLYKRLEREVDQFFARFYVRFSAEPGYIHHFVHFGGYHPATEWPQGGAGSRPRGDDRITVGIEPWGANGAHPPPGVWTFYNYWVDMKASAGGRFWGNGIAPADPLVVPRDRWQCVEVMIRLNSFEPDGAARSDGELVLWLDGRESMRIAKGTRRGPWSGMGFNLPTTGGEPFEGFRWRTSSKLKLNFVWLLHYVTGQIGERNKAAASQPRENTVWFDNVVVATEYIGPIAPLKD